MLGLGVDTQELTRLKIDSHLHRQSGVPFEPLVRSHRALDLFGFGRTLPAEPPERAW